MSKDRNALKSGLFILVTIVMIIAVIIGIRGLESWTQPRGTRAVFFSLKDDVGGLQVGDDVRVGGYKVGIVQKISVEGASEEKARDVRVRVEFTFPNKYVLHRDAVLRIQTGVTGASCLNFESLGAGPKLPESEEITGRPGTLAEVLATITQLGDPVKSILNTVDKQTLPAVNDTVSKFGKTADQFSSTGDHATKLIDDARAQVDPVMQHTHTVMEHATVTLDKVRDFFGDTTSDFRATMKSLASISGGIDQKLPGMLTRVDSILSHVDATIESANGALQDVKATVLNAKDLTSSAKSVIGGNKGKLDNMISSLKAASDNLKNATAEIRRSPWRLLYKPAPNEMANLNLYDAAREFAEGANELNDASLALRDALQNEEVDKDSIEKMMQRVQKSFDNFHEVEQKLWSKVKE